MSWAPAAQAATAVVKLGQQQQHTPQHRQRQQQPQQRQLLQQQRQVQPQQLITQPHQQFRTQRSQRDSLCRASAQIHEVAGQKHRRPHNSSGLNVKSGSAGEAVSGEHAIPPKKSCNSCSTISGEAAAKRGTQPGSTIVASQMFKTKLCIDHQTRGCTRGDICPYAHSVEEMRNLPDLRKTKMCSLVLAGKGCKNRACKYAHSEEELRYTCTFSEFKTRICRFAQERGGRGCLYGVRCPYAHSPSELRPLDNSTVPSTANDNSKEKRNGVDGDGDAIQAGQRTSRSNPDVSDLPDIKGKHGFWRQQPELQPEHSTAQQQQDDGQQQRKERLKQHHQVQIWQKSQQQKPSQQARGEQKLCQGQQQDLHQQRKQPRMQARVYHKQQQLRNIQPTETCSNRNIGGQSQQDEAETSEIRTEDCLGEVSLSGVPSSRRSTPIGDASALVQQKNPSPLLEPSENRKQTGGSALAKLPRSLNKGMRATSTMTDNSDAGLQNIIEGRPQDRVRLNSAEHLRQEQDAHQRKRSQVKSREPKVLQCQEEGSQRQSSISMRHVQQHFWEQTANEEEVETYTSPELVQCQGTFLSVGETSQRYLSTTSSAETSLPSRIVASLTAAGEERSTIDDTYYVGGAYGDAGSEAVNDSQRECLHCFSATSETSPPGIGTETPTSERDQSWSHQSTSSKRYNGATAVLPPPGFEHVRVKPLPDFAYAGTAPWLHTSGTTQTSNREECLLFHLHKQLLLHCQRQSDAHLLPSANIMSHPPSTANASTACKMNSAISYLGGGANNMWEDAFFAATRSPNR